MNVKCYSVRLKSLVRISDRAFLAVAFDGSKAVIPESQIFGPDPQVKKSDAYWIAAWILEKSDIQHSNKKIGYWNKKKNTIEAPILVKKHVPIKIESSEILVIKELIRK